MEISTTHANVAPELGADFAELLAELDSLIDAEGYSVDEGTIALALRAINW